MNISFESPQHNTESSAGLYVATLHGSEVELVY